MFSEVWINGKGSYIEVSWNEEADHCFYRPYPWKSKNSKMWKGFTSLQELLDKGYIYAKTIQ